MFRAPSQSFGQMQIGQVSGPSLEEVLSQRGFDMPVMPTGVQDQMMRMFKDPLTGKMTSGGAHAASHANAMSDFYAKNPEALKIAKQHQQDQQYNPSGGGGLFNASPLRPPQEINMPGARPGGNMLPPDPNMLLQEKRPNPFSSPLQQEPVFGGQPSGGMGGGIGGLQQFMQIMQMIMQMVQQFQGGSMGGMRNNFAQPQRFGGFNQYQSQQQNFNNPYGPY